MKNSAVQQQTPYRWLVLICGTVASSAGVIALLGWGLGQPFLSSLGAGKIPMAPSTALLFLLYGTSIFLRTRLTPGRGIYWIGGVVHVTGAVVASLLFILSIQGIFLGAEHLGFPASGRVDGAPIGHMSPVTALLFLVTSLAFLASLPSSSNRPWRAIAAGGLACLLVVMSFVLILAYLLGSPLFYSGSFVPPAWTTSLAFEVLGIALLALSIPQVRALSQKRATGMHVSYLFILIFVILVAGIVTGGYLYYENYQKNYRIQVENQLLSIAELKVADLVQWRSERLANANYFYQNPVLSSLLAQYLQKPGDVELQRQLEIRLVQIQSAYLYDRVFLLDTQGMELISATDVFETDASHLTGDVSEVLRAGQVTFLDFHRDAPESPIYLSVLVPIFNEQDGSQPLGVLVLRIDPEQYLYPFINRWPGPTETAETLIVRRDGDDVLFLNELRFQANAALNLRIPLSNAELPAVMAALGQDGIVQGIDYRGEPVVAAVQAVPDSPWFLVARVDIAEVYAPVREMLWVVIALIGALLTGAGVSVGFIWRQQSLRFYQERAKVAEELERSNAELERFTYTVSHDLRSPLVTIKTFLGYLKNDMSGSDTGRIEQDMLYMDNAAVKMGQLLDELLEMSRIGRIVNPSVTVTFRELVQETLSLVAGRLEERRVEVQVSDKDITLYGDRPRLVEVWQNLVENATKFMGDQSSPRIDVGVEQRDGETIFFVRDNGMGIEPKYQPKLFSLFEKINPKSEGAGMGLAIVKRIVELYQGTIRVESKGLGQGACFWFTLPGALKEEDK